VAQSAGTPRADRELREFKHRSKGAVCQSFHYHLARLIEMLHSIERIQELMEDPEILSQDIRAKALLNRLEGHRIVRGAARHAYSTTIRVDANGLVKTANLLIATAQNNLAMNMAVEQTARRFVTPQVD
jgi:NAD-reducing hydrogenase large subunit